MQGERKLVKKFDQDGDGRLSTEERQAARLAIKEERNSDQGRRAFGPGGGFGPPGGFGPDGGFGPPDAPGPDGGFGPPDGFGPDGVAGRPGNPGPDGASRQGGGFSRADGAAPGDGSASAGGFRPGGGFGPGRGFGPPGGFGPPPGGGRRNREPPKPGARVSPDDVKSYAGTPLYELTVLRTLFLDFEGADWEAELADFHRSDVEVPATLTVDGTKYPGVGVHFRGNTSFMMAGEGFKRPLNLSLDYVDSKQRLYGYKTLNLLNAAEDPTFLHTVLYLQIARQYFPAPKANFVRLVINGENWGIYVNVQQFDKPFLQECYPEARGVRWKVPVSFRGEGGLSYMGEDIAEYQRFFEMKSDDGQKAWKDLVAMCRALNETPLDKLEATIRPLLDVDHVLWYLALDNVLINNDGYWIRGSDYCLFRDSKGQFHVIPHDVNESFGPGGGPGMGRRGGSGIEIDPLAGADDPKKPLLSRLLAVPGLKAQYLGHVRTIAAEWLDWKKLGPIVEQHRSLIGKEVEADTRKLYSLAAFKGQAEEEAGDRRWPGPFGGRREMSIEQFARQRRDYLLSYPAIAELKP